MDAQCIHAQPKNTLVKSMVVNWDEVGIISCLRGFERLEQSVVNSYKCGWGYVWGG